MLIVSFLNSKLNKQLRVVKYHSVFKGILLTLISEAKKYPVNTRQFKLLETSKKNLNFCVLSKKK